MKKSILISTLASALFLISSNAMAGSKHDGHSSGNKGGKFCQKAAIGHIKPKHLSTVAPGSEFSFWVNDLKDAKQVEVTAKKIPVEMVATKRIGFILFKGKLPASLSGTAARIQVKAHTKKCPTQKGWLLKITE